MLLSALAAESTLDLPQEQFPLEEQTIPITTVLKTALKLFDKTVLKSAPQQTWKGARCSGIKKDAKVPSEPCYHFELFKIISQWASRDGGLVYCEANCPTLQDTLCRPTSSSNALQELMQRQTKKDPIQDAVVTLLWSFTQAQIPQLSS